MWPWCVCVGGGWWWCVSPHATYSTIVHPTSIHSSRYTHHTNFRGIGGDGMCHPLLDAASDRHPSFSLLAAWRMGTGLD
ncbi:hypothetical protein B0T13DRAFT_321042 [Neurospora crassa]|nr:hypothetical protein B0T13DRAFT_321042 [Neurospora crassa]